MDGRKRRWLVLCLAGGLAGCAHEVATLPVVPPAQSPGPAAAAPPPPVVETRKDSDLPKRTPKAATCVAAGDFYAHEAEGSDSGSAAQEGLRSSARKAYQQALTLDPKCLTAYRGLAQLYLAQDDQAHAIDTYHKALAAFPNDASLWFDLGMIHARKKDWPPAVDALNRAATLDPENRNYVNTLGYTLARAGRYQDSFACFCRVQSEARAHYNLARMLEHLGQPELSKEQLRLALQLEPGLAPAAEQLARMEGTAGPAPAPAPPSGPPAPVAPAPAPLPTVQVPAPAPQPLVMIQGQPVGPAPAAVPKPTPAPTAATPRPKEESSFIPVVFTDTQPLVQEGLPDPAPAQAPAPGPEPRQVPGTLLPPPPPTLAAPRR